MKRFLLLSNVLVSKESQSLLAVSSGAERLDVAGPHPQPTSRRITTRSLPPLCAAVADTTVKPPASNSLLVPT